MRVTVLGAGSSRGRRVVRDLLDHADVGHINLLGTDSQSLAEIDPRRMTSLPGSHLADALAGADVALACLEDALDAEVAALLAARAAGVTYLTACEHPATIESLLNLGQPSPPGPLGTATPGAGPGSLAVVGVSWTPGLSNLLVCAAAQDVQRVRSVQVSWFVSRDDEGAAQRSQALLGWPQAGRRSVDRPPAISPLGSPGRAGRPAKPGNARNARGKLPGTRAGQVFFPEPVGWQRVHPVPGAELSWLAGRWPYLEALFVVGGMSGGPGVSVARSVSRAAQRSGSGPGESSPRKLDVLSRNLISGLAPFASRTGGWSALRVDVSGNSAGVPGTITLGLVDHLVNLESAPLAAAGLAVGRGEILASASGVVTPDAVFDPAAFLAALAQRGIRVARLER